MKKAILIKLDKKEHTGLKVLAASRETTMARLIRTAIRKLIKGKENATEDSKK